jgi:hypothetical protein
MTAKLYYSLHSPSSWSATSTKTGYSASNAATTGIRRPWASNATGAQQLIADLGSSKTIRGLAVQSCPVSAVAAYVDNIATPTTDRGDITPAQASHGIYRGLLAMNVSARYASAYFDSPTLLGANAGVYSVEPAVYEVGAMYAFGAVMDLPVEPLIDSDIDAVWPQSNERLPNGAETVITRGAPFVRINMRFRPSASHDIEKIARIARAGLCWLDLGVAARPELSWPVRWVDDNAQRRFSGGRDQVSLSFREIT